MDRCWITAGVLQLLFLRLLLTWAPGTASLKSIVLVFLLASDMAGVNGPGKEKIHSSLLQYMAGLELYVLCALLHVVGLRSCI